MSRPCCFWSANEWHNEGTILDVRAPIVAPASDEYLNRERASYEERPIRVVGEKPVGKEGAFYLEYTTLNI
ncbi:MAG: hypothetical protein NC037_04845 [Bacteroides sp.]|nr:hypothetical protein [Bacillota bacterium]MCM1394166.1 hypothetical protein [[Eubacterium] siraeum]MCM1455838.1 hypothetical protein [Bacteroides sp.]